MRITRIAVVAAGFIVTILGRPMVGHTQPLDFFHALIMRRAVIEREVEFQMRHAEGRGLRETEALLAIDFPPLPRWQLELAVPFSVSEPSNGPSTAGVNDITLENKFLLWSSHSLGLAVTGGLDVRLPTGPKGRGAGETAVTPFLSRPQARAFRSPARPWISVGISRGSRAPA
jgi:hypothetical protein